MGERTREEGEGLLGNRCLCDCYGNWPSWGGAGRGRGAPGHLGAHSKPPTEGVRMGYRLGPRAGLGEPGSSSRTPFSHSKRPQTHSSMRDGGQEGNHTASPITEAACPGSQPLSRKAARDLFRNHTGEWGRPWTDSGLGGAWSLCQGRAGLCDPLALRGLRGVLRLK